MRNSKLLILFLSVPLLSACSKVFTQKHLAAAERYCDDKGGIYSLEVFGESVKFVNCKNGDRTQLSGKEIKE